MAALPRRRVAALACLAAAGAGILVLVARHAADRPTIAKAGTSVAAPLPGLPLVAVPPIADLKADGDRLAALEDLARADPSRGDVQMALGAEHLVKGDGAAAATAFAAAQKLGTAGAEVGLAVAAYDPKAPDAAIERLRLLAPSSPFARYELGVLLLWAGRVKDASAELQAVRKAAPGDYYGVKADDLLHPTMQSGYPIFVPTADPPEGATLDSLRKAAQAAPQDPDAQLQYGAALQAGGDRSAALESYRAALSADPTSVEARVASAVAAFSKDDPAQAFGTIGPLVRDNPGNPSPRFHLALMLLWIGQKEKAQAEFDQVAAEAPGTRLARLAGFFAPKSG